MGFVGSEIEGTGVNQIGNVEAGGAKDEEKSE
jgi:hypothetical protein